MTGALTKKGGFGDRLTEREKRGREDEGEDAPLQAKERSRRGGSLCRRDLGALALTGAPPPRRPPVRGPSPCEPLHYFVPRALGSY